MAETFTLDEPAETFTIDVPKRRTAMESLKEGAVGAGETALSMASGAIAAPVGGLVGLTNLPFGRERATEQARAVQEALTYAPRTQVGQQQMGMVSYPFTKLSELATRGGENVLEATGSPGLATQAQVAMEAIPYILSRAARPAARSAMARREAALNAEASRNLVANETLRRAQAEGFVRAGRGLCRATEPVLSRSAPHQHRGQGRNRSGSRDPQPAGRRSDRPARRWPQSR